MAVRPEVGRRWNLDPVVKEWESSYCTFRNNPILYRDLKGDDAINGYKEGRDKALTKKGEKEQNWKNLKENPIEKSDKEGFIKYKSDLKIAKQEYVSAKKEYNRINRDYEQIEMQLNDYAWVDPEGYNYLDNIPDPNNPLKEVDVYFYTKKEVDNNGHLGKTDLTVTIVNLNGQFHHYEFGSQEFGSGSNKVAVFLLNTTDDVTVAHEKVHVWHGLTYPQFWYDNQGESDADLEEIRYKELKRKKGPRPDGWVRPGN